MKSLTRLQIYGTDAIDESDGDFYFQSGLKFQQRFSLAASDPTFLPNLATIIELPNHLSLEKLCQNRPIVFFYHHHPRYMHIDICPSVNQDGPGLDIAHDLSAHDVGVLIRESYDLSPKLYCPTSIIISMRFPTAIKSGNQAPVVDPLAWTRTMLAASKIPSNRLFSLHVSFEPKPQFQTVEVQFADVQKLYADFPKLKDISISNPRLSWSRGMSDRANESRFFEEDTLPEWTPCPSNLPHCIDWWLKELRLGSPGTQSDEEFAETIAKLVDGVFLRWDPDILCSPEELIDDLYKYYNRSKRN
ncbi:hypothetical protein RHS01_02327 [Rhizoctonia solani]|uniref:Uncharacterized protein n=1 Tax=Rhizoctonia solani TaxID=456999 RepID=A0A8H7M992_9AGAM|nr:hypothetical protein RHS01_02327 [Rhizoctonia solani]